MSRQSSSAAAHPRFAAETETPWRSMNSAPKDGRWILAIVQFYDDNQQRHEVATAARYMPEHGGFCGLPAPGGIGHLYPAVSASGWMPQPEVDRIAA